MPTVDEVDDESECFPFRKVSADELPPALALGSGDASVSEAGKIDEVQAIIYKVKIELLRLARSAARASQSSPPRQQIEQRALSYVGPPDKRDFRPAIGRQRGPFCRAGDELRV